MKKIILPVLTFIVAMSSVGFANCIGDISKVSNASCITEYSDDTDIEEMDTVTFGSYPQSSSNSKEPIEWIVLDKQGDKALLLSKYILDEVILDNTTGGLHRVVDENSSYNTLDIRKWLNNDFFNTAFNENDKKQILQVHIPETSIESKNNENLDIYISSEVSDKVFFLSTEECEKYFLATQGTYDLTYFKRGAITEATNYANKTYIDAGANYDVNTYWLRTYKKMYRDGNWWDTSFACIQIIRDDFSDEVVADISNVAEVWGQGVRPAIWVSLSNSNSNSNSAGYITEEGWIKADPNMPGGERDLDMAGKATVTKSAWEKLPPDLKAAFSEDQIIDDVSNNVQETTKQAPKNGWDGDYYYQNDVPVKNTWVDYGSDKYYCGSTGAILKNQWIDNTYYVDNTGKMLKNTTTPDGYKVGADGKYIKEITQPAQSVLDNVHIEGADIIQKADGTLQIGGVIEDGDVILQKGNDNSSSTTNDNYYNIALTNEDIKTVKVKEEPQYFLFFKTGTEYKLNISLSDAGNRKLKEASERNIGQSLYLVCDGKLLIDFKVDKVFNSNEGISVPYDSKEQAQDRMNKINGAKSVYLVEGDYQSFINNENSASISKNPNNRNEEDDIVKPSGIKKIYGSRKNNDTKEVKTNLKGTYVNIGKDLIKLKLTSDIIKSMTVERENIDGIALDSTINNILFSDEKTDKCFIKIILDFSHIPLQSEMQEMQKFLSECYTSTIYYDGGDPDNEDNKIIKSLSIEDSMVFSPDIVKLYVDDEEKAEKVIKYINKRLDNYGKSTLEIYYYRWDLEKGYYMKSPKLIGASEIEIVPGNAIIPAKAYLKFDNEIKENFNKALDEHKRYKYLVLVMPDFVEANIKKIEKYNISGQCPLSNYQFVSYRFNNLSKESIKSNKIEISIEDVVGHPFMNEDADTYYSMENMKKKALEYPYVMILSDDVKHYVKK